VHWVGVPLVTSQIWFSPQSQSSMKAVVTGTFFDTAFGSTVFHASFKLFAQESIVDHNSSIIPSKKMVTLGVNLHFLVWD
jgi:hypothetical protein